VPSSQQPAPTGTCPTGTTRRFSVIQDVHVGLLSSSLGTFGADGCPDSTTSTCADAMTSTANNDHGHLVTRTGPCAAGDVPTYASEGFLAWDPSMKLSPPGISVLGGGASGSLETLLVDLVQGDGQNGCGFDAQNESWYRFLVDPTPYESIALVNEQVQTSGTDAALLAQRADFLRPNSLLAIVELTHKPDGSLKESSEYPLFADIALHLPHATTACTTKGPTDPCCTSCGQVTPMGCAVDPACTSNPDYSNADENIALRAFGLTSHKQRYGIEFFYPPSRYVTALTAATVTDENGNAVTNPIFAGGRDPRLVFYAAITGVPWQLIAREKNGAPDLVNGVSALDPTAVGGFKTYAELALTDPKGNVIWDDIAGNPEAYVAPLSPFMVESTAPRSGVDPITAIAISPVTSPNGTNSINGHEYTIASPPGDIEYACVYPLLSPIDCSVPGAVCDCTAQTTDDPLCDPNPNDNMNRTLQTRGKAYPGLKHLAIAKGMKAQGIVASICPAQLTSPTALDYGYNAAAKAIVDALATALAP
jgi:hypothetical protein